MIWLGRRFVLSCARSTAKRIEYLRVSACVSLLRCSALHARTKNLNELWSRGIVFFLLLLYFIEHGGSIGGGGGVGSGVSTL